MKKIEIEYCADGLAVSDFEADEWLREVMAYRDWNQPYRRKVSTSLPLHLVRLAIATGQLRAEDVTFVHAGKSFSANEYGAITDWPEGFADVEGRVSERILRAAIARRRAERVKTGPGGHDGRMPS